MQRTRTVNVNINRDAAGEHHDQRTQHPRRRSLDGLRTAASVLAAMLACLGHAGTASAQPCVITTPTTIGPGDTMICGNVPLATAQITVQGTTLTINRSDQFTIASLVVQGAGSTPGVVTHTPGTRVNLNVTGNVTITSISRIDVNAKGFAGSLGLGSGESANGRNGGGGGYGGAGGDASGSTHTSILTGVGGPCYGFDPANLFAPTMLGSGGGNAWSGGNPVASTGGLGGGAVILNVGGTLTLNGTINANGGGGGNAGCRAAGGGSGGSVFVTCASVTGTGSISANGGAGAFPCAFDQGGGGGGGRIAVITNSPSISATLDAIGGTGNVRGGCGTIYTRVGGQTRGTLIIDNSNASIGETTELFDETSGPLTLDANVVIRRNGLLGPAHSLDNFNLTVLGNFTVESTGFVSAGGRGFRGSQGPGRSDVAEGANGGGGGYGGAGGDSSGSSQTRVNSGLGGFCYGFEPSSLFAPTQMGSGGGNVWSGGAPVITTGGFGGGVLVLDVRGTLTVNGSISANGGGGSDSGCEAGGGGSGGSVFVTCASVTGTGSISANGGAGAFPCAFDQGGGGGGGRIAVITNSPSISATLDAIGGTGNVRGGCGTIYTRVGGQTRGTLIIDNSNASIGETTELFDETSGPLTLDANIVIRRNGLLGPAHSLDNFNLTVLGNVTVESTGFISAGGRGFRGSQGPGAGGSLDGRNGGGGGYGGVGGRGSGSGGMGGTTYGDCALSEIWMGSGGGNAWSGGAPVNTTGGFGGGVLVLDVRGTLTVNGSISANGGGGSDSGCEAGGGGSGGSVFVTCASVTGTGSISANGGAGAFPCAFDQGGGGGGGRVVVYSDSGTLPTITVNGGSGANNGQAGTIRTCRADFNCNRFVNSQDFFDFLSCVFQQRPECDINMDGFVNSQDYFDFLTAFFSPC